MWVVIGGQTLNLDRVNVIMPCEEGTEFVFDAFSTKVNIPYDDVVETVTRKHK